jgi:hypothetical protein
MENHQKKDEKQGFLMDFPWIFQDDPPKKRMKKRISGGFSMILQDDPPKKGCFPMENHGSFPQKNMDDLDGSPAGRNFMISGFFMVILWMGQRNPAPPVWDG